MRVEYRHYRSILEIKQAHIANGGHFFDADTLRWWNSRVSEIIYGGRYFVTSERGPDTLRRYTVRCVDARGNIDTVGDLGRYSSRSGAHRAAAICGMNHTNKGMS